VTDFDPLDTFRGSTIATDEQRSARILEEFRARIATMAPDDDGRRPFDPKTSRHRRVRQPVLALVVLALILGLAAGGAFWMDGNRARPSTVQELAATASTQPDVSLDVGQYLYRVERTSNREAVAAVREEWTARDGTGQATTNALQIGPAGSASPSLMVYPTPGSLHFADLSYEQLRQLPTDADALLARLNELGVARSPRSADQAEAVAAVMGLDVTPPGVVTAAINALEKLGGRVTGSVGDGAGRTGIALQGENEDGTAWVVALDPDTGRALAFFGRVPDGEAVDDSVPHRVWLDQRITDSLQPG